MDDKNFYTEEGGFSVGTAQNENKKQVLLIGDSIRVGYCEFVKENLKDLADVYYPSENCRNTQYIITALRSWRTLCDPEKVNVIHFNAGHWDVAHWSNIGDSLTTLDEYGKNLCKIIAIMRLLYPNAKIIFATTTPMNPNHSETINPRTTKEIIEYNNIAKKVCLENNVIINDLFSLCKNWTGDMFKDYAHLVEDGYKQLANQVCEEIKKIF